ncbi:transporter substrate-binding domain-containing protein [Lysinibacter cavernae]|uniref:Polar amino acid transport system substrate-binding protein n=1 Tax=Lysinibacter cavernae TaxID=1640652 RepID=A0A7X5R2L4_9MICO|nr:transporter substrate-binding domain-containing protein [Lysinibacter cavernae]NIH54454.1 polar amino acid transport system substrate-binding protein [Lysinibacter cavernae]
MNIRTSMATAALLSATALLLSGCSDAATISEPSTSSTPGASAAPDLGTANAELIASIKAEPGLKEMLPQDIIDRGHIINLSQIPNAPMEYTVEGTDTLIGADIDMINALSAVIGIDIKINTVQDFAALMPGLTTGRTDMVLSSMIDKAERQESASFVDMFDTFASLLLPADSAGDFTELSDFCGESVIAETGTLYPGMVETLSQEECVAKSLAPINLVEVAGVQAQLLQIQQGRGVAAMMAIEVMGFERSKDPGAWEVFPAQFGVGTYGVAFAKDNTALGDTIQRAFEVLHERGVYQELLATWNLEEGARDDFPINGATMAATS